MKKKYSIITISFNNIDQLKETADAISQLKYKNFEWIVIDGGSRDGTRDYLAGNPQVSKWISEPDAGIADAWNKGIQLAEGRYITILNSGDTYRPEFLDEIDAVISEQKIYCSHATLETEDKKFIGTFFAQPQKLWRGMHIPHNWAVVPAKFYQEFGPYKKLKYAMDFEWFHRYFIKYGRDGFHVIEKSLGSYRLGGVSDKHYQDSFLQNARIMTANGQYKILAYGIAAIYIIKHKMKSVFR